MHTLQGCVQHGSSGEGWAGRGRTFSEQKVEEEDVKVVVRGEILPRRSDDELSRRAMEDSLRLTAMRSTKFVSLEREVTCKQENG